MFHRSFVRFDFVRFAGREACCFLCGGEGEGGGLIDNLMTDSFMYHRMSLEEVSIVDEIWWEFRSSRK